MHDPTQKPIRVWMESRGHYFDKGMDEISLKHLTLVRLGNRALTRRIKPIAQYELVEFNGFGAVPLGYFAPKAEVRSVVQLLVEGADPRRLALHNAV